jgi:FkbH-like protein
MTLATHSSVESPARFQVTSDARIVVSATFTAEPIGPLLLFWLKQLGLTWRVEFAPHNQIFQELLDPGSLFACNDSGINLLLIRFEDWARFKPGGWDATTLESTADELADSLLSFAKRSNTPTILCVMPPSPLVSGDSGRMAFLSTLENRVRAIIAPYGSVHWLGADALLRYPVQFFYDEVGDRIAHMPYTAPLLASVSTAVARRIHLIKVPACKVVALDCDNTLWAGVVGEDGPEGITLGPGMKAFQEFIVSQQAAGMLVCLVSKNSEADVLDAFDVRPDFPLRREHLVSWRINWGPKSQGLTELAEELNLGLDSFVFLDDNPVECAEVQSALPQVLTLRVPPDGEIAELLPHLWAFDRLKVTEEDRKRTLMYIQNANRSRSERQTGDISTFLASLNLQITIVAPTGEQWARVAQLTQRTNQFNFTTIRRTVSEVSLCGHAGLECLCVEVSDRFGEYGLVGVLIFGSAGDAIVVDSFLLSCRVLGRGVEHAMLAHLGRLASDRGLEFVEARHLPTPKNEPAGNFLRSVAAGYASESKDGGTTYRIPVDVVLGVAYHPGSDARKQLEFARTAGTSKASNEGTANQAVEFDKSAFYTRVATELRSPEAVVRAVETNSSTSRNLETPLIEPSTAIQRDLVTLWGHVLLIDRVGIDDEFNALGGSSIQCARLFVEIESNYGVRLPMSTILEAPTIRLLAERLVSSSRAQVRSSLKLLKPGVEGGPTLFLVHDGDGETLLYLNLARRLADEVAVYGIEPLGNDYCPMVHTRIPEMAADYVARVREVCPEGPYLVGGLCAGGVIAFEMALQLRAAGQPVGLVALLEAADARAEAKPYLGTRRRWARFVKGFRREAGSSQGNGQADANDNAPIHGNGHAVRSDLGLKRLVRYGEYALTKLSGFVRYKVGLHAQRRIEAAKLRALRAAAASGQIPDDLSGLTVRTVYEHAERSYTPVGLLDVPALLVRGGADGKGYPADEPLVNRLRDLDFGWGRRLAAGPSALEIVDATGGHGGILQEPHVAVVATCLQDAIDRATTARVR